jgi:hypothetical protein
MEICVKADPPEYPVGANHTARCFLHSEHATEDEKRAAAAAGLAAAAYGPRS